LVGRGQVALSWVTLRASGFELSPLTTVPVAQTVRSPYGSRVVSDATTELSG
jgi:hypothetical protein